jgi:hypothetical protein
MRINIGRVVIGGLVAGIVLNALDMVVGMFVLADDMKAMVARLNLDPAAIRPGAAHRARRRPADIRADDDDPVRVHGDGRLRTRRVRA